MAEQLMETGHYMFGIRSTGDTIIHKIFTWDIIENPYIVEQLKLDLKIIEILK